MALTKAGTNKRKDFSGSVDAETIISLTLAAISEKVNIAGLLAGGQVVGIEYECPATATDVTFNVNFYSPNDIEIGNKDGLTCATGAITKAFSNTTSDNIHLGGNNQVEVEFPATVQAFTMELILYIK